MRFTLLLLGGLTAAIAGCQSSGSQYGLSGEVNQSSTLNQDQRSLDYSNSNSSTTIDKSHDNFHNKDSGKPMDNSSDLPK